MARQCYITGKKTVFGNKKTTRGKAKYLGGVGTKLTGITRRKIKPNLRKVRAIIDGEVQVIHVSARCIRAGAITKPVKHKPFAIDRK